MIRLLVRVFCLLLLILGLSAAAMAYSPTRVSLLRHTTAAHAPRLRARLAQTPSRITVVLLPVVSARGWHVKPGKRSIASVLADNNRRTKIYGKGGAYLRLRGSASQAGRHRLLISYKSNSRLVLRAGRRHVLKRSSRWRQRKITISSTRRRLDIQAFGATQIRTLRELSTNGKKRVPGPTPKPGNQLPQPAAPTTQPMYWGAWVTDASGNQSPWEMSLQSAFESRVGKAASLINWSSPFYNTSYCGPTDYCDFQTTAFDAIRAHGAIPFFSWSTGPGTGAFSDAAIAGGSQDAYIANWAEAAKNWGHPFFLRFSWEMNGDWFPWGAGYPGNTAADYVAMWQHVHNIFTSVGADNVTWVWAPNIDPSDQFVPLSALYPGDAYVDWTGLDGYNGDIPWTSFADLFRSSYDEIMAFAADKPMVIPEVGSTEAGGSKPAWITDMFNSLGQLPQIRALLWFDSTTSGPGDHTDWPVESSASATAAFAAGISDPLFESNVYGQLDMTGPIAAP